MKALELFKLDKKVALITGGYGHLGKAMTRALADAGAITIVCGRDKNKFKTAFPDSERMNIFFEEMDISNVDSIENALRKIFNNFKKVNILVNNAIYLKGINPETITNEEWKTSVDGALNSVFRCIKAAVPYMKRSKDASIINISSMYGIVSPDFRIYEETPELFSPPHYGAAKAGVIHLTKYYAAYLARHKIRVNCISPGPFPTTKTKKNRKFVKTLSDKTVIGRYGSPEELGGPLIFLASNASSFMTGHNMSVDGGWTII